MCFFAVCFFSVRSFAWNFSALSFSCEASSVFCSWDSFLRVRFSGRIFQYSRWRGLFWCRLFRGISFALFLGCFLSEFFLACFLRELCRWSFFRLLFRRVFSRGVSIVGYFCTHSFSLASSLRAFAAAFALQFLAGLFLSVLSRDFPPCFPLWRPFVCTLLR